MTPPRKPVRRALAVALTATALGVTVVLGARGRAGVHAPRSSPGR